MAKTLPLTATLTLALGIGLAGTIFGFTYGSVLVDLPFDRASGWVLVERLVDGDDSDGRVNAEDLHEWRAAVRSFDALFAFEPVEAGLADAAGVAERIAAVRIEPTGLDLMGVRPVRGRLFTTEEGTPGGPAVVLLGEGLWRRRYGAAPEILGRIVRVDGTPREVIGIMPHSFGFPTNQEVWIPLALEGPGLPRAVAERVSVAGRIGAASDVAGALRELRQIDAALARRFPETNDAFSVRMQPYTTGTIGAEIVAFQVAMLGVAVLVLLVAAVNVANLLLARGVERAREFAIRLTLGESRNRLRLRLLGESGAIAAVGGLTGVGVASLGLRVLTGVITEAGIPPPFWFDIGLTPATLGSIAGLAAVATLVAGLPPALQATRVDVRRVLQDEGRGLSSARANRLMRALLVAQIALTTAILSSAAVMVRSMQTLRVRDYGMDVDRLLTAKVSLPASFDREGRAAFWEALERRLASDLGKDQAALTSALPVREFPKVQAVVTGKPPRGNQTLPSATLAAISPSYFDVIGSRLLDGRAFTDHDTDTAARVAIVNQSFVRRHFAQAEAALGTALTITTSRGAHQVVVVGVVPDLWMDGPRNRRPDGIYVPLTQRDVRAARVLVRGRPGAPPPSAVITSALASVDPDVPAYEVWSMGRVIERGTFFYFFLPSLFLVFGITALALASVGLFAVMTFGVQRRRFELSIRSSLGATPAGLVGLVLRNASRSIALGVALGGALGLVMNQSLTRFLVAVTPTDPFALALVGGVLFAVSLLAAAGPAVRAGRVPPAEALKAQ
ncbi:MAG: ABC transporter permease [Dehalococcoidia bacterium]